jgi:hypothetical protein
MAEDENDFENKTPYDLRQIYAKLVGEHMTDISIKRKLQRFSDWFRALQDLYTITNFKYDGGWSKKEYNKIKQEIINLSNDYAGTWMGGYEDSESVFLIDQKLRELEEWIYEQMQKGGIFGKGYEYDPDEI